MDKDAASEDEAEESSDSGDDNDDEDEDIEEDSQLRAAIEEALKVNGIRAAVEDDSEEESEEDLMDDDQMMAVDAQLAAVFKARAEEKGRGMLWLSDPLITRSQEMCCRQSQCSARSDALQESCLGPCGRVSQEACIQCTRDTLHFPPYRSHRWQQFG